jgi:hypothetical protein
MGQRDDVVAGGGRDPACAETGLVVGKVAGEGLRVGGEGEIFATSVMPVVSLGPAMGGEEPYFECSVKPTANPIMSPISARITASSTSRNVFLLRPKYRRC